MLTLRECITEAEKKHIAIGHFNISNLESLWAIVGAARALNVPVIIGTSEGERAFIGIRQAVALVKSIREEFNITIFLNADHSYSFEKVKAAVDAGYDAVIFDGAKLTFDKNLAETRRCVTYAKSVNKEIIVEGELGYIGTSSELLDKLPEGAALTPDSFTTPEESSRFVRGTGVDLLAPAVGNIHGMLKSGLSPNLSIERIKSIRSQGGVPLVLHGGSGISDEDFKKAIEAGISIIHINTEIRVAYRDTLKIALLENPDEVAPYKLMKPVTAKIQALVLRRLRLFNKM